MYTILQFLFAILAGIPGGLAIVEMKKERSINKEIIYISLAVILFLISIYFALLRSK